MCSEVEFHKDMIRRWSMEGTYILNVQYNFSEGTTVCLKL